jgi:hypothetical protein
MKTTLLIVAALIVGLVAGFFIGRRFPAHHYVRWGDTTLVYDTTTGKVCDPVLVRPDAAFPHCGQ